MARRSSRASSLRSASVSAENGLLQRTFRSEQSCSILSSLEDGTPNFNVATCSVRYSKYLSPLRSNTVGPRGVRSGVVREESSYRPHSAHLECCRKSRAAINLGRMARVFITLDLARCLLLTNSMKTRNDGEEDWQKLCRLVANEADPHRLSALVDELISKLDARRHALRQSEPAG